MGIHYPGRMSSTSTDSVHQLPIDEARERLRVLIRDLAEAGADIAAVAVIVHRADASRDAVEQAGHRYLSAYDISELEI